MRGPWLHVDYMSTTSNPSNCGVRRPRPRPHIIANSRAPAAPTSLALKARLVSCQPEHRLVIARRTQRRGTTRLSPDCRGLHRGGDEFRHRLGSEVLQTALLTPPKPGYRDSPPSASALPRTCPGPSCRPPTTHGSIVNAGTSSVRTRRDPHTWTPYLEYMRVDPRPRLPP